MIKNTFSFCCVSLSVTSIQAQTEEPRGIKLTMAINGQLNLNNGADEVEDGIYTDVIVTRVGVRQKQAAGAEKAEERKISKFYIIKPDIQEGKVTRTGRRI